MRNSRGPCTPRSICNSMPAVLYGPVTKVFSELIIGSEGTLAGASLMVSTMFLRRRMQMWIGGTSETRRCFSRLPIMARAYGVKTQPMPDSVTFHFEILASAQDCIRWASMNGPQPSRFELKAQPTSNEPLPRTGEPFPTESHPRSQSMKTVGSVRRSFFVVCQYVPFDGAHGYETHY